MFPVEPGAGPAAKKDTEESSSTKFDAKLAAVIDKAIKARVKQQHPLQVNKRASQSQGGFRPTLSSMQKSSTLQPIKLKQKSSMKENAAFRQSQTRF